MKKGKLGVYVERETGGKMFVDLHVHTTASDGSDSPKEVVYKAKKLGLKAIAITDHDTIGGIKEALQVSGETGVEVLSGIELSTEYQGMEVHVLGYLIDIRDDRLLTYLANSKESRSKRILKIVKKLQKLNFPISFEDVLAEAGDGSIGRPHVAKVLVRKGIVSSIGEAFDQYIGQGRVAFVPREKCTPVDAVNLIRGAGGVAVLAHPGLADIDQYIPYLVKEGLQGIEVYHPQHNQTDVKHYLNISRRWNLLATGGSDYHGKDARGHEALGTATVRYQVVGELYRLARG